MRVETVSINKVHLHWPGPLCWSRPHLSNSSLYFHFHHQTTRACMCVVSLWSARAKMMMLVVDEVWSISTTCVLGPGHWSSSCFNTNPHMTCLTSCPCNPLTGHLFPISPIRFLLSTWNGISEVFWCTQSKDLFNCRSHRALIVWPVFFVITFNNMHNYNFSGYLKICILTRPHSWSHSSTSRFITVLLHELQHRCFIKKVVAWIIEL